MSTVKTAIFPVAGLGTRFLPATKVVPKELLPVLDKPLIQYAVEECLEAGIEKFVFVTSEHKSSIDAHFRPMPHLQSTLENRGKANELEALLSAHLPEANISVCYQNEPLGLGHAVLCARESVNPGPVAILLPDDFILSRQGCIGQMIDVFNENGGNILATMNVPLEDTSKYGILSGNPISESLYQVSGMVEKPKPEVAPTTLAIIGRYILQPQIFEYLANQTPGAGGEIQLTDAMARLLESSPFYGYEFEGTRFDCGHKKGMVQATIAMAQQEGFLD